MLEGRVDLDISVRRAPLGADVGPLSIIKGSGVDPTKSWYRSGAAATSSASSAASTSSKSDEITARPRLSTVQAANCAAFAAAWAAGENPLVPFAARPIVADGFATPKPARAAEVLGALRPSRWAPSARVD